VVLLRPVPAGQSVRSGGRIVAGKRLTSGKIFVDLEDLLAIGRRGLDVPPAELHLEDAVVCGVVIAANDVRNAAVLEMGVEQTGLRIILQLNNLLEFCIRHACTPGRGGI